ncbi:hypothetical protein SAMN05428985_110188 [Nocardioides sp. YR527]|uniref:hypothetical protein n=1 Tax=Nocardioides sp. YR527 TaxID=1881028 RepID=UPI0008827C9D|nr:hypothetical protein [Nocardioides sp. YR527]SDL17403.1 hypothetical protein SAMN05428985_110188 [Nocardioides sp. YR527]
MVSITEAVLADELPAITAWAERHGWEFNYDSITLRGRAVVEHPRVADLRVVFWFDASGYPNRQPPAWWCGGDGATICTERAGYPRPSPTPPPGPPHGSIFHTNPVICAPWNRLAYSIHGGPHADWPALAAWRTCGVGYTQAHTIADMLSALEIHLARSDGMQT